MTDLSSRAERPRTTEIRNRPFAGAELRDMPDGTGGNRLTFTGYASVTNTPYEMEDFLGAYTEVVRSGSFGKTLSEGADVPFKLNHEGITLARTKSGTMQLAEDSTGLHVEAYLDPASPAVQTLRSAMDRGDVDEMSFGFRVTRQEWSPDYTQRDITEVNMNKGDVSVVNYGANPHTAGLTSLRGLGPDDVATLRQVLQLISAADGAVDVAQPLLAGVLGVENPDADDDDPSEAEALAAELSLHFARARALDF